jgi:hypothetical protein
MRNTLNDALAYVRSNIDMSEVEHTRDKMYQHRTDAHTENPLLCDRVYDLLEEYGADYELEEGWWMYEKELNEIIEEL